MARHGSRFGRSVREEATQEREDFLEDARMEIEHVCEEVRDNIAREFRVSKNKAYAIAKKISETGCQVRVLTSYPCEWGYGG